MNAHSIQAPQGDLRAPLGKLLHRRIDVQNALSIGTTSFYRLVNIGKIRIVKIGSSTFVTDDSLRAYVASLVAEAA